MQTVNSTLFALILIQFSFKYWNSLKLKNLNKK